MKDRLRKLWPWAAAAASGAMLAMCYPRWDVGEFVWFWQIPLFFALWFSDSADPRKRWRRGLALGYVAGLTFFLINLSWLFQLSRVAGTAWAGIGAWLAMPGYLAIYFGLWGAFAATTGRWKPAQSKVEGDIFGPSMAVIKAAFLCSAAWCGLEWLRGVAFTGFGWNGLGVALHENVCLIQIADLIGVTGLSFVIVFCNAVWTATLARVGMEMRIRGRIRPHLDFAAAVILVIAVFSYGLMAVLARPKPTEENSVSVRTLLVQLNTQIDEPRDEGFAGRLLDAYRDLTSAYVGSSKFDLVIWPESSMPAQWTHPGIQRFLNEGVLNSGDFSLILGFDDHDFESERFYNCAGLLRGSTRDAQIHRKLHLVPFGEYIPLRNSFPVFAWIAGGIVPEDFSAGASYEPLKLSQPEAGIIPLVCFEDTMGSLARKFVRPGPQLLVNVTNDGWFFDSSLPIQHLVNAKFRCVELRRPMARAANTGVSGFIDEIGSLEFPDAAPGSTGHQRLRVVQDPLTGNTFVRGTLPSTVTLQKAAPITFYARFGDVFSVTLGGAAALAALLGMWRRRGLIDRSS
jgi:apolipoprotein N-acyltransferase